MKITATEHRIMAVIVQLGNDATIGQVKTNLQQKLGKHASEGAIYTIIDRAEKKGLIDCRKGSPIKVRGGRAKLYFSVNESGIEAIKEAQRINKMFEVG